MEKYVEEIRDLCCRLAEKYPKYFKTERDPKLMASIQVPEGETVFLSHDDTLFHSGKDGFIVTDTGFYADLMLSGKDYYTSFEDVAKSGEIYETEYVIYADNSPVCYCSAGGAEVSDALLEFVQSVKNIVLNR